MFHRAPALLGLMLALPCAWGQDSSPDARKPTVSDRSLNFQVDNLLRSTGTKLIMEPEEISNNKALRREANKVYYHTSNTDQRLVRIEIEPVGEESPASSKLAATFLAVLGVVESMDEGMKLADMLTAELAKDGRTRSISLGQGVKFMKEKKGDAAARYVISL